MDIYSVVYMIYEVSVCVLSAKPTPTAPISLTHTFTYTCVHTQDWFARNNIAPVLQAHLKSYSDMDGPRRVIEVCVFFNCKSIQCMCICVPVVLFSIYQYNVCLGHGHGHGRPRRLIEV